jgi:peroxiredoxin-like protein
MTSTDGRNKPARRSNANQSSADQFHYHVSAWWSSGRAGLAKADSSHATIHFAAPVEFGGMEGRWTPEELLLAAVASCYTTTLGVLAAKARIELTDLQVEASVSVTRSETGYAIEAIELRPGAKIASAEDGERILELLHKAEKLCLVARALRTPVKFIPQLDHSVAESSR